MSLSVSVSMRIFLTTVLTLSATSEVESSDWTGHIKFNGDIRLRHDSIDEEGESGRESGRYRTRFGVTADATDDVKIVIQIASGGDNPVSANQSFDHGFSTKEIGLDLAYVDWAASDNLHIVGGKMKNPLFRAGKAQLIWDGDFNPAGVAARYTSGIFFGTFGVFSADRQSSSDDSLLYTVQAGMNVGVGKNASLQAGAGYLAYSNTVGHAPFFDGRAKGNTIDINGNYVHEYKHAEFFVQFDTSLGGWPLSVYAHAVQNTAVSAADSGFAVGAKVGAAKAKGSMEFGWTFMEIGADAVISTFHDSDFAGGNTDSSGHVIKAKYALSKHIALGGTVFVDKLDRVNGVEHDYDRLQLDIEFKF